MSNRFKRVENLEAMRGDRIGGDADSLDSLHREWLSTAASDEDVDVGAAIAERMLAGETIPEDELRYHLTPIAEHFAEWLEARRIVTGGS